jgi:hypothetical protein
MNETKTQSTKRRGRPSKADALTPAQRMQRTRGRAVAALEGTEKTRDLSESALLELVRIAYQKGYADFLAEAVTVLFERMGARHPGCTLRPTFERVATATVAAKEEPEPATVTEKAKPSRHYPDWIKRQALALAEAGKPRDEILEAIRNGCGKSPDSSNFSRLMRQWRETVH